jgi:hypothetical protein
MWTWRKLKAALDRMSEQALGEPAEILAGSVTGDEPHALCPMVTIGRIGSLCGDEKTRSSFDNQHHAKATIIVIDVNPFAEDGSIGEDLLTGERIFPRCTP